MRIPSDPRERSLFAREIISDCCQSRAQRIQNGIAFRNLFLTGDENGIPSTFLRTQDMIRDILAMLYSPAGLRFAINYFGYASPADRAKARAAASGLHQHVVENDIDDHISDVVLWSLIKGKVISQMVWSRAGFEPYLIQPESFAVYEENKSSLERQQAFVHTTFETRSRFRQMISGLSTRRQAEIMKKVNALQVRPSDREDGNSTLKQIIVGGLYPYQAAGMSPATNVSGGTITHLFSPQPTMQADVVASMVPIDELWVWNNDQDDWATITMVGDEIIFGGDQLFNAFAHDILTMPGIPDDNNPLRGKHGFVEYCPMPLDGFFWGISYCYLVALLQKSINKRVDGINIMLRREEDPPRVFKGSTSINQNAYAKLNKPGGYFADSSPNASVQDLAKEIPPDLWKSFHELNSMFDVISGFPPIMQGQGEGSVRSQGQSDTLLRTGAARHLDAALKIERSVERTGSICFDMLRAKDNTILTAWCMPGVKTIQSDVEPDPTMEPPVEGMVPISFQFKHINPQAKVSVDAHSASPAFRHEVRELAFGLAKIGAATPERVVEMTHPPMEDVLVEDAERKQIEQAALIKAHPELLEKGHKKH
jgi:hypothetical protein